MSSAAPRKWKPLAPALSSLIDAGDYEQLARVLSASSSAASDLRDHYGQSLLHLVAKRPDGVHGIRACCDAGVHVDAVDGDKWTALHVAAWYGHVDSCMLLLDLGACPNKRNDEGLNAFAYVASFLPEERHSDAYRSLLHRCAPNGNQDMAVQGRLGENPLHFAAYIGNEFAARMMLEHGAYVDPQNRCGESPLMVAVASYRANVAELLLAYDADPLMPANSRTPLSVAASIMPHLVPKMNELVNSSDGKPEWVLRPKSEGIRLREERKKEGGVERPGAMLDELLTMGPKHKGLPTKMREFLFSLARGYYRVNLTMIPPERCEWPAVLHNLMLTSRDVLSLSEVRILCSCLSTFLQRARLSSSNEFDASDVAWTAPRKKSAADQLEFLAVMYARGLHEYLTRCRMDPNNSLLGLRAPEELIHNEAMALSEMYRAYSEMQAMSEQLGIDMSGRVDSGADVVQYAPLAVESVDVLMSVWLEAEIAGELSLADVGEQALKLARLRRAHRHMEKVWSGLEVHAGDLVISIVGHHPDLGFSFFRYSGERNGPQLRLWADPEQRVSVWMHEWMVAPLSERLRAHLGNKNTMARLVQDPLDGVFAAGDKYARDVTVELLVENDISAEMQKACMFMGDFSLQEGKQLSRAFDRLRVLLSVMDEVVEEPAERVRAYVHEQYQLRVCSMRAMSAMFAPTRAQRIAALISLDVGKVLTRRLERIVRSCGAAVEQYEEMRSDIMSGREKQRITQWWLARISHFTSEFLERIGYDLDALPFDYLSEPPARPEAVQRNFQLIEQVLDNVEDKHGVKQLVHEVQNEIYPTIKQFIENAQYVISDALGASKKDFSLRYCKSLFERLQGSMPQEEATVIGGLLADLEYLVAAQELDDAFRGKSKEELERTTGVSHIVPISGLVIGSFYRRHRELETVMEMWSIELLSPSNTAVKDALSKISRNKPMLRRMSSGPGLDSQYFVPRPEKRTQGSGQKQGHGQGEGQGEGQGKGAKQRGEGEKEREGEGEGEEEAEGEEEGDAEGAGEEEGDAEAEGDAEGDAEGEEEGEMDGEAEMDGDEDGEEEGDVEGEEEGE
eukprot:TRINITY_DN5905_c0_g2_i2.p1 TRINITY_DN5905_c0_g2~~TRINITY_DN5905_c0_g2_i2.p1  ORF type:complete len:1076 (-),score=407.17 TRINITY_DN5905_c0_g2_i2:1227-4454(-)